MKGIRDCSNEGWLSTLRGDIYKSFGECIFANSFHYYLTVTKDMAFHLNKTWIPFINDASCQVWLKLAQCLQFLWRFFNFVYTLFVYYLPFEEGVMLHLNKSEFPLPKNYLCQVWLIIGWMVVEKNIFVNVFCCFLVLFSLLEKTFRGCISAFL